MRKIIAAALGLLCTMAAASVARAEDHTHAGPYVGIMGGYGLQQLETQGIDLAGGGGVLGLYAGYGIVGKSGLYLGIEADAMMRDVKITAGAGGNAATSSADWSGSLRGRLGYAMGPVLIYGTGGAAYIPRKIEVVGFGSDTQATWAPTAGVGIEVQLGKSLTLGLEGRHTWTGNDTFTIQGISERLGGGETLGMARLGFKL